MNKSSSLKLKDVRVFSGDTSAPCERNKVCLGGEVDKEEAQEDLSLDGLLKSEDSGPAACSVTTAASSSGLEYRGCPGNIWLR